jgi:outer membrane PBP1 activator LpoA protein
VLPLSGAYAHFGQAAKTGFELGLQDEALNQIDILFFYPRFFIGASFRLVSSLTS